MRTMKSAWIIVCCGRDQHPDHRHQSGYEEDNPILLSLQTPTAPHSRLEPNSGPGSMAGCGMIRSRWDRTAPRDTRDAGQ